MSSGIAPPLHSSPYTTVLGISTWTFLGYRHPVLWGVSFVFRPGVNAQDLPVYVIFRYSHYMSTPSRRVSESFSSISRILKLPRVCSFLTLYNRVTSPYHINSFIPVECTFLVWTLFYGSVFGAVDKGRGDRSVVHFSLYVHRHSAVT